VANSFYGREDTTLADQLIEELPGILLWALDGWRRLRERGHFVQPASGEDAIQHLEDLASPVKAFARARCEVKPGARCDVNDLYQVWRDWCQEEGRDHVTPKATFGRDLRSAYPHIRRREGTTGAFYDGICLRPGYQPGGYAA
jgi:putative DNA primase/helicase